ncbi:FAD-dependent oxidoreductase [Rhabdothermincola sediminis]|uniref:FAD-dependent oxidoreductase n=1 Tax=Rhabdothermincola sediminis TaxID=2751370 RepID=UPI00355802F6
MGDGRPRAAAVRLHAVLPAARGHRGGHVRRHGRLFDPTWGELEGRRRAEEAAAFVQAHVPGFAGAFLSDTATQQGVRETRHVLGQHTLTGDEVMGGARFPDAVLAAAWAQEYHVSVHGTEYRFLPDGVAYQLPYRSLVPSAGPSNLLVAGRCLSADHHALASCRVMAPCFASGEATGATAAMLTAGDAGAAAMLTAVDVSTVDITALRDELVASGAILDVRP